MTMQSDRQLIEELCARVSRLEQAISPKQDSGVKMAREQQIEEKEANDVRRPWANCPLCKGTGGPLAWGGPDFTIEECECWRGGPTYALQVEKRRERDVAMDEPRDVPHAVVVPEEQLERIVKAARLGATRRLRQVVNERLFRGDKAVDFVNRAIDDVELEIEGKLEVRPYAFDAFIELTQALDVFEKAIIGWFGAKTPPHEYRNASREMRARIQKFVEQCVEASVAKRIDAVVKTAVTEERKRLEFSVGQTFVDFERDVRKWLKDGAANDLLAIRERVRACFQG